MSEPRNIVEPYDLTDPESRHQAAGEYVLNTLTSREKASFEALLAFSHDLQADVQQWREHLQVLDRSLTPVAPPAKLWKQIEQQIQPARKGFGLKFWQLSSMVSFSFALALTSVLLLKPPMLNSDMADHLYVVNTPEHKPAWLVNTSMDRSHLMIQTVKPAELPDGKICKLWLKVGDKYAMIGTLPHSGLIKFDVPQWIQSDLVQAQIIISIDSINSDNNPDDMGPVVDKGDFMPLEGSIRRF
ncbi:anti-sigma factor [Oceanospirillum maris]|jgi:anti-sigma-K factor RskA|uniref:anti-sigma factor n=1 Tax=Oceanospirillum maris TaxID=64977 RepID=UPI0004228D2D|nr:hypothetical protein [Oceanospirillum maris]